MWSSIFQRAVHGVIKKHLNKFPISKAYFIINICFPPKRCIFYFSLLPENLFEFLKSNGLEWLDGRECKEIIDNMNDYFSSDSLNDARESFEHERCFHLVSLNQFRDMFSISETLFRVTLSYWIYWNRHKNLQNIVHNLESECLVVLWLVRAICNWGVLWTITGAIDAKSISFFDWVYTGTNWWPIEVKSKTNNWVLSLCNLVLVTRLLAK